MKKLLQLLALATVSASVLTGSGLCAQTLLSGVPPVSAAQADSPEHYLLQAFSATDHRRRPVLNHIGMLTVIDADTYIVDALLDGYPALRAGLRRGDHLLTVNGVPFHPLKSFNAEGGSEGGASATYQLRYERNGEPRETTVTPVRDNLYDAYRNATINSVQEFSNGNKIIGYVHLWAFSVNTNDLQTYLGILESLRHCDGLIIDVRDAAGFVAAEHLDWFFPSRRDYRTNDHSQMPSRNNPRYYDREIAILQNTGTGPGPAVFASLMGQLQRIITVGTGNGSTSPEHLVPFPLDSSLAGDPQYDAAVMALMAIM